MPIYEFFCPDCNTIFNFFSRRVSTDKQPDCPKCGRKNIRKMMSTFAIMGKAGEEPDTLAGMDEAKMEKAFAGLLRDAENVSEDDPRQMAGIMRKFSDRTGVSLGEQMEEALARLESGENPEQIEQEMGDVLDGDGFSFEEMKKQVRSGGKKPQRDDRLYELE